MDKRYRNRIHHQRIQNQQKAIFLPMLCSRTSTRNVYLPRSQDHPSSPKISCIGQAMRNNKLISFPRRIHHPDLNYFKLKRLFSGKNPASSANPVTISTNCEPIRRDLEKKGGIGSMADARSGQVTNIADLDPPLPVTIKKRQECDKAENLWQRRLGGVQLTSLLLKAPSNRHLSVQRV